MFGEDLDETPSEGISASTLGMGSPTQNGILFLRSKESPVLNSKQCPEPLSWSLNSESNDVIAPGLLPEETFAGSRVMKLRERAAQPSGTPLANSASTRSPEQPQAAKPALQTPNPEAQTTAM